MNKKSICAVVVTYNRKELLIECLNALVKQTMPLDAIYLIDNDSNDGTPELLFNNEYINELPPEKLNHPWEKDFAIYDSNKEVKIKLKYVRLNKNTGGAGGFYEGVKRAYESNYDWIWLMDDDSEPEIDSIQELSNYFHEKDIAALSSSVIDFYENDIITGTRGYFNFHNIFPKIQKPLNTKYYENSRIELDFASFCGILIKNDSIKKIGFPKKEFFINNDDIEYCIRLRKIGKILLIPNSIVYHKEQKRAVGNFLGKSYGIIPFDKYWVTYYGNRNLVWLGKLYNLNKRVFYFGLLKEYIKNIMMILFLYDYKVKRSKILTSAYMDGLKGIFDNNKHERIK